MSTHPSPAILSHCPDIPHIKFPWDISTPEMICSEIQHWETNIIYYRCQTWWQLRDKGCMQFIVLQTNEVSTILNSHWRSNVRLMVWFGLMLNGSFQHIFINYTAGRLLSQHEAARTLGLPFGSPVDPLVYIITAISALVGFSTVILPVRN